MSADIHALTGAYALDAVSDLERAAFERHLSECEQCAQEVAELRSTAARLGTAAATEPPPELKARVLARIGEVRQLPRVGSAPAARPPDRSRWPLRLSSAAAAVLLIAGAVLGVLLVREQQAHDETRQQASALASILQAGDARMVSTTGSSGGAATVVFSRSQDRAVLLATGLPELESSQTYQAWLIDEAGEQSAGLLSGRGAHLDVSGLGDATGLGVTVEPAGGSQRPSTTPIMALSLLA